jgi:hypothetical protein
MGQKMMAKAATEYLASLSPLTPAQIIQAFSRAAMECKFCPSPRYPPRIQRPSDDW